MISLELLINRTYIYLLLVVCIVLFKKTFEMKKDTYPHRRPTCSSHLTQPQPRRIHQWPSGEYPKWFWWWIACKIEVIILIRWYYDCYFGTRCYFCRLMIINMGGGQNSKKGATSSKQFLAQLVQKLLKFCLLSRQIKVLVHLHHFKIFSPYYVLCDDDDDSLGT